MEEWTISVMRLMAKGVESGDWDRIEIRGSDRIKVTESRSADSVSRRCIEGGGCRSEASDMNGRRKKFGLNLNLNLGV